MTRLAAVVALGLLASCATHRSAELRDPLQGFNRKIFWFNDRVDTWVLEPVARGYDHVTPDAVQRSVSNFFTNLRFPIVTLNDLLQGKVVDGGVDVGRFLVNTTVGVLGFFDPATGWHLPRHDEDFGQTLGVWGVPPGPYLVLPLLGPSSPRDALGLGVDTATSVQTWFVDWWILAAARVFDTVNARAQALDTVKQIKEASVDYYVAVRNGYAQRRAALVNDEAVPSEQTQDELYFPDNEEQ
jgi:phospholipid-binding lipoprotein MlaA